MVTLRDVAEAANVSIATASRVLNGTSGRRVFPESERSVREAARKLGYQPNQAARTLRTRRSDTLGMVVPHITNPFFAGIIQAAGRALDPTAWELLIGDAQQDVTIEHRRLRSLAARQVDGVIFIPCDGVESRAAMAALDGIPVVQVDRRVRGIATDWIGVNHMVGIERVVHHLRHAGRQRLCFAGAQEHSIVATERLRGYEQALSDDEQSAVDVHLGDFTMGWGTHVGAVLADRGELPDAVVCGNDLIALGVLRALRDAGVRVPQDVAVTGFDDIDFVALVDPPLTTVRQPVEQIGEIAMDLLQHRILEPGSPLREVRLTPEVIVRRSSAAEPSG